MLDSEPVFVIMIPSISGAVGRDPAGGVVINVLPIRVSLTFSFVYQALLEAL